MSMFKKLVGDGYYKNVVLGTTCWDSLTSIERGEDRECELRNEDVLWAQLIRKGSKIRRLGFSNRGYFVKDTLEPIGSDLDVLLEICENHQSDALRAQREMDRGLNSAETSAVMELNEWRERARHHKKQMEQCRADMQKELATNGVRLGQELEQKCLLMDQADKQQARKFALDKEREREIRRKVDSLIEQRSGRPRNATPVPESVGLRSLRRQIETSRRDNDNLAQQLVNDIRRSCSFYQRRRRSSGVVDANPSCKRCDKVVSPGEKFFHCCSCRPSSHNYHQCEDCGNRCGRDHVDMAEMQVATR